ncbi:MAG: hypothetical protein EOM59_07955 [Clostridia bacterium]|nr:hypothetical protein [Clostridia bacterium]
MKRRKTPWKKRILMIIVGMLIQLIHLPIMVFAADAISLSHAAGFSATQGDSSVYIVVEASVLSGSTDYELILTSADSDITVTTGNTGVFAGGTDNDGTFIVKISKSADIGDHTLTVRAVADDVAGTVISTKTLTMEVAKSQDSYSSSGQAAFDVDYTVSGGSSIVAGQSNTLSLSLFNRGNTVIKNARVSLSLPEGISIKSGAATINAGYISIGKTYVAEYPIIAETSLASKSYPIVVKIAGLSSSNTEVVVEETIYVPVAGSGGAGDLDLEIVQVSAPESVSAGKDFVVTFAVKNKGSYDASNIKATLKIPEGMINKTKNVFLIHSIASGESQPCTVTLNAQNGGQYALFEISAGNADGSSTVSQYAGTMVTGAGGSVNPQLMVSAYGYGGTPVKSGEDFYLSLSLHNTSAGMGLQNIKVTVTSDDSAFLPVGTSNSFYIPSIASNSVVSHVMHLAAGKDAEQKTSTVTVNMSYEDTSGGTHTSTDIISIPVIQETRLVIDEILDPGYLTADQMGYLNVNYYNMGKTQLSNLRIKSEGDFTVDGSATMYVGNMGSGKSDYYSINFFPNGPGPLFGKVTFTFEDAAGDEQTIVKEFSFNIGEAVIWEEDPNIPPEDPSSQGLGVWKWLLGLAVVGGGSFTGYRIRKKKKARANEEFNLDE